jgi:hypothetical protein
VYEPFKTLKNVKAETIKTVAICPVHHTKTWDYTQKRHYYNHSEVNHESEIAEKFT